MTEDWRRWWPFPSFAPDELTQSINRDWSFGNLIINNGNSSAPGTEAAILAKESYGRQIGKLLDAVAALIEERPDRKDEPAFSELLDLRTRVEDAKCEAAKRRVEQLRHDLALLRIRDVKLHDAMVESLRPAID